jgi:hypothetical protein
MTLDWKWLQTLGAADTGELAVRVRRELMAASRLGAVLVRHGLVSAENLEAALETQRETGGLLGQILTARDSCTQEELEWALSCQHNETMIVARSLAMGWLNRAGMAALAQALEGQGILSIAHGLLNLKLVTPTQLATVMAEQDRDSRLGQFLVSAGWISEDQLELGLRRQLDSGELLGEALLALGACDAEAVERALLAQALPLESD